MKYYAISVHYNKKLLDAGVYYAEKIDVVELDYEPINRYKYQALFEGKDAGQKALWLARGIEKSQKTKAKEMIKLYKTSLNLLTKSSKKETKIILKPLPKTKK